MNVAVGEMNVDGQRELTWVLHDLTGRVRLEEQLRERAALARLGEMAAVIAHEVKNPLAAIRGAIQSDRAPPARGEPRSARCRRVLSRVDALNKLVQDLLLYARPPQPKKLSIEVAPLLTTTAELLAKDPALQQLRVDVRGSAPAIEADPELLKIAFLNLFINGAHAMAGHGTLKVSIERPAGACRINVADSGPGIPATVREKLFTPFFTTKSQGTGLGLVTVKRIVEAHDGTIDIRCRVEGGTTVTISLPAQRTERRTFQSS